MEPSDWLSVMAMSAQRPLPVVIRYISAESSHVLQNSASLRRAHKFVLGSNFKPIDPVIKGSSDPFNDDTEVID